MRIGCESGPPVLKAPSASLPYKKLRQASALIVAILNRTRRGAKRRRKPAEPLTQNHTTLELRHSASDVTTWRIFTCFLSGFPFVPSRILDLRQSSLWYIWFLKSPHPPHPANTPPKHKHTHTYIHTHTHTHTHTHAHTIYFSCFRFQSGGESGIRSVLFKFATASEGVIRNKTSNSVNIEQNKQNSR